jgi:hypothetical protein
LKVLELSWRYIRVLLDVLEYWSSPAEFGVLLLILKALLSWGCLELS